MSGRVAHRQSEKYNAQAQQQYEQQQYEQQMAAQQYAAQQQAAAAAAAPAASAEDESMAKLKQLADLHNQGVLSDEEFAAAKAKVLGI